MRVYLCAAVGVCGCTSMVDVRPNQNDAKWSRNSMIYDREAWVRW